MGLSLLLYKVEQIGILDVPRMYICRRMIVLLTSTGLAIHITGSCAAALLHASMTTRHIA